MSSVDRIEPATKRPRLLTKKTTRNENEIPNSQYYQVSYAHRSMVTRTIHSIKHDMILTSSQDGIVKFWKRTSVSSPPSLDPKAAKESEASGQCIEFIKSYQSHTMPILNLVISHDGDNAASVGEDSIIKFYDVGGFDVTGMIRVKDEYTLSSAAAFLGEQQTLLAVASGSSVKNNVGNIFVFSSMTLSPSPLKTIQLHASKVLHMAYNYTHHTVVSCDQKGFIEYWNGSILSSRNTGGNTLGTTSFISDYDTIDENTDGTTMQDDAENAAYSALGETASADRNGIQFSSKMDTDLYNLVKKKIHAIAFTMSPTGQNFAIYGSDRKVRLFDFRTGKTVVQYDERMKVYEKQLSSGKSTMDAIDFGNRAAREREMGDTTIMDTDKGKTNYQECGNQVLTIQFDPSGRYLILPTMIGVKVIEWSTNKCKKVIGKGDASTLRFLGGALILGKAKVDKQMMLARNASVPNASSSKSNENDDIVSDSLFVTMAFNKRRFYIFSHLDTISKADESGDLEEQQRVAISRDILNEPPDQDDLIINQINGNDTKDSKLGKEAILRTTMGDIHIKLFPDETPKTVENFCGHARNGYYDNVIFHRVIKSFMIQTGDPLGDGTGGESIWGGEFEDEIVKGLRHDRPFTGKYSTPSFFENYLKCIEFTLIFNSVSMANAGPNTNGSQFFITTVPTPWLDNKHTVFGRVTRGMDVCSTIENVKVDELDKPFEEISILSVDIL